jgi:co-chaperonin GroES (HSP10)
MIETSSNKIVYLPNDKVRAVGKGVIVTETTKCCKTQTDSGIFLPNKADVTKKYDLGEVIAVGKDVLEVKVGDLVLFQTASACAFPLPNGIEQSVLTKIDESPVAILCIIPKADIEAADAASKATIDAPDTL